jgi:hypothetical protein
MVTISPHSSDESHLFTIQDEHVATTTDDWYTPRWIFEAAQVVFDLDVAAPMDRTMQHVPAKRFITAVEDGLAVPWEGSVWCNPPYSGSTPWVEKWASHDGEGMILVPAVKSRWIGTLLAAAESMTLLTVEFHRPGGVIAPIRWLNLLAGKGPKCAPAVARVAAADKHAQGGYFVRGVA